MVTSNVICGITFVTAVVKLFIHAVSDNIDEHHSNSGDLLIGTVSEKDVLFVGDRLVFLVNNCGNFKDWL